MAHEHHDHPHPHEHHDHPQPPRRGQEQPRGQGDAAGPPEAARLRDAVHRFLEAPSPELQTAMVAELQRGAFLAVVIYDPPLPPEHDGQATIPAGTTMRFRGRVAPDGSMLLAIYSDLAAVRKDLPGHPVQTTVLTAERMVEFALHPPHKGAVLNPAGPYLELREPELRSIVPEAAGAT